MKRDPEPRISTKMKVRPASLLAACAVGVVLVIWSAQRPGADVAIHAPPALPIAETSAPRLKSILTGTPDSASTGPSLEHVVDDARAGSAAKMRELAQAMRACADLQASDESEVIRKQAELAESYRRFASDTARPIDEPAFEAEIDQSTNEELRLKRACEDVSPEDAGAWLNWLERAAAAGDLDAKREYASAVLSRASDASELLANIDELAVQKRNAFGFLEDVLASGDCSVSNQLELLAPSPVDSYTYALLEFEWGKSLQPQMAPPDLAAENIAFMQIQLDKRAAKVAPAMRASAQTTAARLFRNCRA